MNNNMSGIKKTAICQLLLWLLFCIEGFTAFQFRRSLLCESLRGFLTCPRSNDLVVVKRALYGRRMPFPKVCGDLTGRPPCSMDTTATLLPYCFRSQNCTFPNTDDFHGTPCRVARQGKYLSFDVACVPQQDVYPVCGSDSDMPVPLPEQGLLAPPFYSSWKERPWRCDVKISGAASMTFEVINDDSGRVPVMACGRSIFVGDLRASPGCRPLSKDQNYTTRGDVSLHFYNTNDTGPQALLYYQVVQKDVLSILTASNEVHPEPNDDPITILPWIPEPTTQEPSTTVGYRTESAMNSETTAMPATGDSDDNTTSYDGLLNSTPRGDHGIFCNSSSNTAPNAPDGVSITCSSDNNFGNEDGSTTDANLQIHSSTSVPPNRGKTEPPKISLGNKIPLNTSANASPSEEKTAIPAYLVGVIVGVLGLIILLLIVAFIVAVCKRREKRLRAEDMTALAQDKDRSREMNIYSTIDIHEEGSSDKQPRFIKSGTGRRSRENTLERAKAEAKGEARTETRVEAKTNSTFNPSEIWYEDKVDFVMY